MTMETIQVAVAATTELLAQATGAAVTETKLLARAMGVELLARLMGVSLVGAAITFLLADLVLV
jgi:hypothetical protein